MFSVGASGVFVAYLAVGQLGQFNKSFQFKDFYNNSSYTQPLHNVIPLSGDRFVIVGENLVTVYGVDEKGRLSVKDSLSNYKGTGKPQTKYRLQVNIEEHQAE